MHWLKQIAIIFLIITLLLVGWVAVVVYRSTHVGDFLTHTKAPYGAVFGDMGGLQVVIPSYYLHLFAEYQGDPAFFEKSNGKERPKRTPQSKLRDFGLNVRWPDMAPPKDENWGDMIQSSIFTTMWLTVMVNIAPYNNDVGLKRMLDAVPTKVWDADHIPGDPPERWDNKHGYQLSSEKIHGLSVYEVTGYDDAKRYQGNDFLDQNIYYRVSQQGQVEAFIECHNVKHAAAPCTHSFILPKAQNVMVDISYRIGLLPHWREIQQAVTKLILSFEVKPEPPARP